MRTLAAGSRLSVLVTAVAMLGATSACSTREASARPDGAASHTETANEPEQVVQNMKGPGITAEASSSVVASRARTSTSNVARTGEDSLAPRGNGAETITSQHLEAELDRLEAELAN